MLPNKYAEILEAEFFSELTKTPNAKAPDEATAIATSPADLNFWLTNNITNDEIIITGIEIYKAGKPKADEIERLAKPISDNQWHCSQYH